MTEKTVAKVAGQPVPMSTPQTQQIPNPAPAKQVQLPQQGTPITVQTTAPLGSDAAIRAAYEARMAQRRAAETPTDPKTFVSNTPDVDTSNPYGVAHSGDIPAKTLGEMKGGQDRLKFHAAMQAKAQQIREEEEEEAAQAAAANKP